MYKNRYYILHSKNVMTDYEFRVTITENCITSFYLDKTYDTEWFIFKNKYFKFMLSLCIFYDMYLLCILRLYIMSVASPPSDSFYDNIDSL